jgi:hypothetical protein
LIKERNWLLDYIERECPLEDEDEQIDELSNKTLGRYVQAASTDLYNPGKDRTNLYHKGASGKERDKHSAKPAYREQGISRAVSRLTKEELDESADPQMAKYVEAIKRTSWL